MEDGPLSQYTWASRGKNLDLSSASGSLGLSPLTLEKDPSLLVLSEVISAWVGGTGSTSPGVG